MNINNTNKLIYKPNVFRILSYILLYGIFGVGNYLYLRSYIVFIACILLAILPFVSIGMLFLMSKKVSIKLFRSCDNLEVSDKLGIGLIIQNNSLLSSLNLKCHLIISNDYYNEKCNQIISVPVIAKSINKNPIICETCFCGCINITLTHSELTDLFGFFTCIYISQESLTFVCLPHNKNLDDYIILGLIEGFSSNEDITHKGNEYSDVSDIREYIPGDRIKDIHWKLSSKRDILLVREHIKSCENKLILWIDRSPRKKNNEIILSFTKAVINYCLSEGVLLKLIWLSSDNSSINEISVQNKNDTILAFEQIYADSSISNIDNIRNILIANHYFMDKVLRVGYKDSEVTIYAYEI